MSKFGIKICPLIWGSDFFLPPDFFKFNSNELLSFLPQIRGNSAWTSKKFKSTKKKCQKKFMPSPVRWDLLDKWELLNIQNYM